MNKIHLLPTIAQCGNMSDILAPFSNVINSWSSKLNLLDLPGGLFDQSLY